MESLLPNEERRSATRAALGRPIRLQFDDSLESDQGTCENLSTGGMFVACTALRPAGCLVRFEVRLDEVQRIRGLGEVVWNRGEGRGPAGLGISFRFLEQDDRQKILKLLSEEIKRRLENQALVADQETPRGQSWSSDSRPVAERPLPSPPAREAEDIELDAVLDEFDAAESGSQLTGAERLETSSIPLRLPAEPFDERLDQPELPRLSDSPAAPRLSKIDSRAVARVARSASTRRWPLIVGAVLLLLVVFGWWWLRGRSEAAAASLPTSAPAGEEESAEPAAQQSLPPDPAAQQVRAGQPTPAAESVVSRPAAMPNFSKLLDISWRPTGDGGLRVVLQGDGEISRRRTRRFQMVGQEPREGVVLRGARQRFERETMEVGGPRVARIRTGYHRQRGDAELHVIFDLLDAKGPRPQLSFDGAQLEVLFPAG